MVKLKRIVSAVVDEQADVFVGKMLHRQYYSIPNTVESVLGVDSVCVVLTLTHNPVKNNCSFIGMRDVHYSDHTLLGLTKIGYRRNSTRIGSCLESIVGRVVSIALLFSDRSIGLIG